jgi:hypothetical protein
MNPIARMMKRYIKTPLKYALPLLFIGALALVSISGCTSSTNPTATPTATPAATAIDSLISKMMAQVPNVHDVAWWGHIGNKTGSISQVTFGYGTGGDGVTITRFDTVANATTEYNRSINGPNELKSIAVRSETPNYWGLSYYKNATGHAPNVQKATTAYVGGDYQQHQSVIQYDTFVISYAHDDKPNG